MAIKRIKNKRGREGFGGHKAVVTRLANSGGILGFRKDALIREKGDFQRMSEIIGTPLNLSKTTKLRVC
jgi:hypothetical protein